MTHCEHQELAPVSSLNRSGVSRIDRMGLTVADLKAAERVYTEALGFRTVSLDVREGEAFAALTSLDGPQAQVAVMHLGAHILELVQFAEPGRGYPQARAANDPWFQHFAIAVRDMDLAFEQLSRFAQQPISRGGPQLLPPSTGDVTAYKFRDPDGHPLELSHAPKSPWAASSAKRATLGIDHSALAVADLEVSIRFYTQGLGLRLGAPALNQGPEQARLDGLDDPVVDIATLTTVESGPHLELLHYRRPKSMSPPLNLNADDIAASRLVMHTESLDVVLERAALHNVASVPGRIVNTPTGRRVLLRDPDGHLLELVGPND